MLEFPPWVFFPFSMFKVDVEAKYKLGEIWGICCTDACSMVRQTLAMHPMNTNDTYLGS